MNPLIVLIIIGVAFLILVGKNKKKPIKREPSLFNENAGQIKPLEIEPTVEQKPTYKYKKFERIVSPAERSFLGVLNAVLDDEIIILTKVRVADVLTPLPTKDRGLWQRAFNSISSKHFDFVLCKSDDLSIICAIELNDKSHNETERQEGDEFIRSACSGAALPLIEVPAKNGYVLQEVTRLAKTLHRKYIYNTNRYFIVKNVVHRWFSVLRSEALMLASSSMVALITRVVETSKISNPH